MDDVDILSKDTSKLSIDGLDRCSDEGSPPDAAGRPTLCRAPHKPSRDITSDFYRAATALKTGELVKDEEFTLFEAVGALEIMDPKMDSGYVAEGELLDDDYDLLRELSAAEILGIMDQLLCFEMAWHMGYPLSQSLFTSLYVDKLLWPEPKSLDEARFDRMLSATSQSGLVHRVLRPFCLGLIKTCDFVYKKISAEHYYEEEDFVLSLYNRDLLSKVEVDEVTKLLQDVWKYLSRRSSKSGDPLLKALALRLELRIELIKAMNVDGLVDKGRTVHWENCIELLPLLKDSRPLGKPVPESFSSKIQRKLASTVPPRPIAEVKFDDAFDLLSRLCHGSKDAYGVLDYYGGIQLQKFVWSFQSRFPQPPTYVRSLMQSLIFSDMKVLGRMSFKQLIFDDLDEIVLPADPLLDESNSLVEAPQDPRFQICRLMDEFITKTADGYIDIFRTLCMNRSRLRRMLCHLVLDWDNIQYEAETLDTSLRMYTHEAPIVELDASELFAFPLSSWCYYQKLLQLTWIVQMGFELDVYTIPELGPMYNYLAHLSTTLLQHLDRVRAFTLHRISSTPTSSLSAAQAASFRRSLSFVETAKIHASATRTFASALAQIYAALSSLGLIPTPYEGAPYSSPGLRYALRMRPFLSLSLPEVPNYDDLVASFAPPPPSPPATASPDAESATIAHVSALLDHADADIRAARTEWDLLGKMPSDRARCQACEGWWRAGVKDVVRSCIKAGIGVSSIRKTIAAAAEQGNGAIEAVKMSVNVFVDVGASTSTSTVSGQEWKGDDARAGAGAGAGAGAAKPQPRRKGKGRGYHEWWVVPDLEVRASVTTSN